MIRREMMITVERMPNTYSKRAGRPIMFSKLGMSRNAMSETRNTFSEHTMIEVRI